MRWALPCRSTFRSTLVPSGCIAATNMLRESPAQSIEVTPAQPFTKRSRALRSCIETSRMRPKCGSGENMASSEPSGARPQSGYCRSVILRNSRLVPVWASNPKSASCPALSPRPKTQSVAGARKVQRDFHAGVFASRGHAELWALLGVGILVLAIQETEKHELRSLIHVVLRHSQGHGPRDISNFPTLSSARFRLVQCDK